MSFALALLKDTIMRDLVLHCIQHDFRLVVVVVIRPSSSVFRRRSLSAAVVGCRCRGCRPFSVGVTLGFCCPCLAGWCCSLLCHGLVVLVLQKTYEILNREQAHTALFCFFVGALIWEPTRSRAT